MNAINPCKSVQFKAFICTNIYTDTEQSVSQAVNMKSQASIFSSGVLYNTPSFNLV